MTRVEVDVCVCFRVVRDGGETKPDFDQNGRRSKCSGRTVFVLEVEASVD